MVGQWWRADGFWICRKDDDLTAAASIAASRVLAVDAGVGRYRLIARPLEECSTIFELLLLLLLLLMLLML